MGKKFIGKSICHCGVFENVRALYKLILRMRACVCFFLSCTKKTTSRQRDTRVWCKIKKTCARVCVCEIYEIKRVLFWR